MPIIRANDDQEAKPRERKRSVLPPLSRRTLWWIVGVLAVGVVMLGAPSLIPGATWTTIGIIFFWLAPLAIVMVIQTDTAVGLFVGMLALSLGVITTATSLAWEQLDMPWLMLVSIVYGVVGLAVTIRHGRVFLEPSEYDPNSLQHHLLLFHRHMLVLGAALLLGGLTACILLSGLIANEHIASTLEHGAAGAQVETEADATAQPPADPSTTAPDGELEPAAQQTVIQTRKAANIARLLLLSMGCSALGALFFVASSCRRKKKMVEDRCKELMPDSAADPKDQFSESRFWGGLWFRLGEAIVFTLVIFLLLWAIIPRLLNEQPRSELPDVANYDWLPVIALFIGMFVKEGERLMQGIRDRVFAVVVGLVAGPTPTIEEAARVPRRDR